MKRKYFLLIGVLFFIGSGFTTYLVVSNEYKASVIEDLSFEERLIEHEEEISALDNYYGTVVNNTTVANDYNDIFDDFETIVFQQKQYMDANNITFEQVRANPSILPTNFNISNVQYSKIMNVINSSLPVSSPELVESLQALEEYVDLAKEVQYSPREILIDATGDDVDGFLKSGDRRTKSDRKRGLQSKEAIRKLKDLLKNKPKIEDNEVLVYPNPLNEFSKISFFNSQSGDVKFTVYNYIGKMVATKTKKMNKGSVAVNTNEIFGQNLSAGVYFLKIRNTEGRETSKKLLIK